MFMLAFVNEKAWHISTPGKTSWPTPCIVRKIIDSFIGFGLLRFGSLSHETLLCFISCSTN